MRLIVDIAREARFLARRPAVLVTLAVALIVSSASVCLGIGEVRGQRATLAKLIETDRAEREATLAGIGDWGEAAYYSFFLTYDAPDALAFAALGQRDLAPWLLRVRALALEGQIYESDQPNPELALLGRLDYAFVVAFLVPLFVIVLLHDLVASERAAGRLSSLQAIAGAANLWLPRAAVLLLALFVCVLLPVVAGAVAERVPDQTIAAAIAVVVAQVAFWAALTGWIAFRPWPAPTIAGTLVAVWLGTALLVPLLGKLAIERAVPSVSGAQIALRQREVVNAAWDLPKEATMERFIERHPEWRDTAPVTAPFHYKWYYAFQQVGDQSVEDFSAAYREAIGQRDRLTAYVAWLSPSVAVQRALQRLADTDTAASLAYDARVRAFHGELRRFWYTPIFNEEPFARERLAEMPEFVGDDG